MVLFPVVYPRQNRVEFYNLVALKYAALGDEALYTPIPFGGLERRALIRIDKRLMEDGNSAPAVVSALAVANLSSNIADDYWVHTDFPGQHIGGASFGLALLVELLYPGIYHNVAFTGFVTPLSPDSWTIGIHDVNHVEEKVVAALENGILIVAPRSQCLIRFNPISGRSFFSPPPPYYHSRNTVAVAATFLEVIALANMLRAV